MDGPARADALNDLLSEIAALGEVEGTGLVRLLRQVFAVVGVADVDAIEGGPERTRRAWRSSFEAGTAKVPRSSSTTAAMVEGSDQISKRGIRGL